MTTILVNIYNRGFAATVHDSAIKAAQAAGALYQATIEDDQIITIADTKG